MLWLAIAVTAVVALVLFPIVVNYRVRRGHPRSFTSDRFAMAVAGTAGLAAGALLTAKWEALLVLLVLGVFVTLVYFRGSR